jgi:hypothetical protein
VYLGVSISLVSEECIIRLGEEDDTGLGTQDKTSHTTKKNVGTTKQTKVMRGVFAGRRTTRRVVHAAAAA